MPVSPEIVAARREVGIIAPSQVCRTLGDDPDRLIAAAAYLIAAREVSDV